MLSDQLINQLKDCKTDKELKVVFKKIASKSPDDYFPTQELKKLGYLRKHCECCGNYFWTVLNEREVCGDPACSGGFQVVINNPSKIKLSFIEVWKKIVEILEPRGYTPIKRYPCVARWDPTSEFTIASISAFQPYVITGEVDPPAKKLLIPQFCLRFNDIENVGITGSHNTGFIMIGQHTFVPPEEWDQGELFIDMHDFIHEGVGLPKEEITIHEDSWAGGGSFGCSLEFFSRGVELFNQVYTMFEQTSEGPRELKLKVLDMGLGQERVAWFSQGTPNMYEAIFPSVLTKLRERTNIQLDLDLYNRFSQFSAYLNIDEVEDMDNAWEKVAGELKMDVSKLRETILPMTGLYSIADHARSLLFAINDGKLPSNVGGGYNLRVIFRRAISFIDKFNWDISMADVCRWHAEELYELFPEVSEHLEGIKEILSVEEKKYKATKKKAVKILDRILKKGEISDDTLIELYDSNGISPDMVKEAAKNYDKIIKIPDDFYALVVEKHEKSEQIHGKKKEIEFNIDGLPKTKSLYYDDYSITSNKAKVLKIEDKMVVVAQSVAYPTSGGQLHDVGNINGQKFNNVVKLGNLVVHILEDKPSFKEGDIVTIEVDKDWRIQLSQHHTATHIVNAAAREVLGSHINQAGAKKTLKNSHLDITHYEQISREKHSAIERRSNEIVGEAINLNLSFIPRSEAERKYGMAIYQGGAVPGKKVRIVEIPGVDIEACGGTHLNNTSETGYIHITKSQKIQDGVVRLTFTAGKASVELKKKHKKVLEELKNTLGVDRKHLVSRVKELIEKWKNVNKSLKTGKVDNHDLYLISSEVFEGDLLFEISRLLSIKKDEVSSKIQKFYTEWTEGVRKIKQLENLLSDDYIIGLVDKSKNYETFKLVLETFNGLSQNDLKNFSIRIMKLYEDAITIFLNKTNEGILMLAMEGNAPVKESKLNIGNFVKEIVENFSGKGGGKKDYGQGFINDKNLSIDDVKNYVSNKLNII